MKRLLVLDNYDSFTYNLVHLVRSLGYTDVEVARNNRISPEDAGTYEAIILSPGPGIPMEAGIMPEIVRRFSPDRKILGVCLGHQCIGEVFGATLINLPSVVHGKGSMTRVVESGDILFRGIPETFTAGRYHSWAVARENFPDTLRITAEAEDGAIMALRHVQFNVRGVQFHPESVLTEFGYELMRNWLEGA